MSGFSMPPDRTISLRTILRLPAVRRAVPEVLTASDDLDRPVRWVHAGEVPDLPRMLRGGELLLTGGMGIGDDSVRQRQFISRLSDRGVAALAIELGVAFDEMPVPLREEAERLGFPLIALHSESAFVEITEAVHREIVSHQHVLMRRGEELHNDFTRLMLEGATVTDILAGLAEAVGNPVVLEKTDEARCFLATYRTPEPEVAAAWESTRRKLAEAPAYLDAEVPMGHDETWGRLIILSIDSPVEDFAPIAVERAAGLLALVLMQSQEENLLTAREYSNLLSDLLEGRLDESEATRRAAKHGWDSRLPAFLPIVLASTDQRYLAVTGRLANSTEAARVATLRRVTSELASLGFPTIGGLHGPGADAILVLGLRSEEARCEAADMAATVVQKATARNQSMGELTICAGAVAMSWEKLREGLRATLDAVPAALAAPPRPWHDINTPDLDRLLWSLRENVEVQRFSQDRLGQLFEHDSRRNSSLVGTLSAYLACGARKAETARQLHLERQSLYQRLQRIESILGEDLDDENVRFGLELALRTAARQTHTSRSSADLLRRTG